jgi:hypothetical protein
MSQFYKYKPMPNITPAYIKWIRTIDWEIEFSPNFLPDISRERAQRVFNSFWYKADCVVHGKNKDKQPNEHIIRSCFLEGEAKYQNFHYHCAVRMPVVANETIEGHLDRKLEFCAFLMALWEKETAAGHHTSCAPIRSYNGYTVYICKKVMAGSFCEVTTRLTNLVQRNPRR